MRALLRLNNLFLVTTYLLLSLVPFFPSLLGRSDPDSTRLVGATVVAWAAVWAIFRCPSRFHWLLLPSFIVLPIELFLQIYYGRGISSHHLGIILESSPRESLEFLGSKIWLILIIVTVLATWFGLSLRAAHAATELVWVDRSRWLALALLITAFSLWFYDRQAPPQSTIAAGSKSTSGSGGGLSESKEILGGGLPRLPAWARVPADIDSFGKTWPFGLTVQIHDFWRERAYLADLKEKSVQFAFGARQTKQTDSPQVLVVVIGESSRYDRWSLNGYSRETNPLLGTESNLVSLDDLITAVSATRLSVPVLMSRKPALQSLQAGFSEKSFLTAFKEAGFKTYWLSNQMSFGKFDTPVSVFANEAEVTRFVNLGGISDDSHYDEVLLEPLKNALSDTAAKKLIVLHTLGNHWNYSHRYPKEFDKWQPSLLGLANPAYTDLKLKQQLNNSYDNSILYTDWFLAQVIGALRSAGQMASMVYISDHGQSLYDGSCKLAFHGHNTQYDFHVPAFVWYSDLYRAAYPEKIEQLLRHRGSKLATENIFHSLLDMADVRYPTEQLERSIFHKDFKQHKRYVDSYGWSDYDDATFKGDCREVISNSKPLPRTH